MSWGLHKQADLRAQLGIEDVFGTVEREFHTNLPTRSERHCSLVFCNRDLRSSAATPTGSQSRSNFDTFQGRRCMIGTCAENQSPALSESCLRQLKRQYGRRLAFSLFGGGEQISCLVRLVSSAIAAIGAVPSIEICLLKKDNLCTVTRVITQTALAADQNPTGQ